MIKALIFDCFGVLHWDNIQQFYDLARPEDVAELRDLVRAFDHGYLTNGEFYERAAQLVNKDEAVVRSVMVQKFERNEKLVERVRELRRDYKIALLSNMGAATLNDIFSEQDQVELFDQIVISSDVGISKPSAEIYELTLEKLDVAAEEAVFIDDRPHNVEMAQVLGMQVILFSGNRQFDTELAKIMETVNA